MLDDLRKPLFFVALIFIALAVLVELGSIGLVSQAAPAANALGAPTPGRGIPALALLDGLVLYATLIMGLALIIPERIQGRLQGIVTLVFSVLLLLTCIAVVIAAFTLLILMVSLLFAPIFGTIAYMIVWSQFNTDGARTALVIIMVLKLLFAVCIVLAHQRFLQNKGLVLIIMTSLAATLVLAILQSFVPGFLVSITDDIGAIIICVCAIVWGLVYLVGGAVSVVKAVV